VALVVRECSPEWRQLVSSKVDGELDDLDTVRLKRHLAGCATCSAWAADAALLAGRLRSAELETPDPALTVRVLPRRHRFGSVLAASAASVAAAAAVAGLALQLPLDAGHGGSARDHSGQVRSAASCGSCRARVLELPASAGVAGEAQPTPRVLLNPVASA
jgi:anti-sigma factor RsiW